MSKGIGSSPLGLIGGHTKVVRPTITVDAANNYADGDTVGGLNTLSGFARIPGGSGLLTRWQMRTKLSGGILVTIFVHIFDSNPSASTFTDNAAISIHANDQAKLLKSATILTTDWSAPKGNSPWYTYELIDPASGRLALEYDLADGQRDIYFAIESDGAINFGAADEVAAVIAALND